MHSPNPHSSPAVNTAVRASTEQDSVVGSERLSNLPKVTQPGIGEALAPGPRPSI